MQNNHCSVGVIAGMVNRSHTLNLSNLLGAVKQLTKAVTLVARKVTRSLNSWMIRQLEKKQVSKGSAVWGLGSFHRNVGAGVSGLPLLRVGPIPSPAGSLPVVAGVGGGQWLSSSMCAGSTRNVRMANTHPSCFVNPANHCELGDSRSIGETVCLGTTHTNNK